MALVQIVTKWQLQQELHLSEVNNRETIAAIQVNNDTYCLQKMIRKFPPKRPLFDFSL